MIAKGGGQTHVSAAARRRTYFPRAREPHRPDASGRQTIFGPVPPRIADFLSPAAIDLPCNGTRLIFTVHAEDHPMPA